MHILLTDETNSRPGQDAKFFIYGGLLFPIDFLPVLDNEINEIRAKAGYRPSDEFKFETNARPEHVSIQDCTDAKRKVVEFCLNNDCKFIAHVILHDIIANQDQDQQIQWAADYVIGRFNKYLTSVDDVGIVAVDNLSVRSQFRYLSDKFTLGLNLDNE